MEHNAKIEFKPNTHSDHKDNDNGCCLTATLFIVYPDRFLQIWSTKFRNMGLIKAVYTIPGV